MSEEQSVEIGVDPTSVEGMEKAAEKLKKVIDEAARLEEASAKLDEFKGKVDVLQGEKSGSLVGRLSTGLRKLDSIGQAQQSGSAGVLNSAVSRAGSIPGVGNIGSAIAGGGSFSGSGISGNLASGAISGGAGLVAAFNPVAGVLAGAVGGVMTKFTDRFFGKLAEVENAAGSATKGRVAEFASRGINLGDGDIQKFLDAQRAQAKRVQDAMEQVTRVQDATSGTIEGFIGNTIRRGYDAIIG